MLFVTLRAVVTLSPGQDLPDSVHTKLRQFYAYWLSKTVGDRIPALADIHPVDIPKLLSSIAILDRVDGDFRFRLLGEGVHPPCGHRFKGRMLRAAMAGERPCQTLREYELCADACRPVCIHNARETADGLDRRPFDRLLLPLAQDHRSVTMVIACTHYYRRGVTSTKNGSRSTRTAETPQSEAH